MHERLRIRVRMGSKEFVGWCSCGSFHGFFYMQLLARNSCIYVKPAGHVPEQTKSCVVRTPTFTVVVGSEHCYGKQTVSGPGVLAGELPGRGVGVVGLGQRAGRLHLRGRTDARWTDASGPKVGMALYGVGCGEVAMPGYWEFRTAWVVQSTLEISVSEGMFGGVVTMSCPPVSFC